MKGRPRSTKLVTRLLVMTGLVVAGLLATTWLLTPTNGAHVDPPAISAITPGTVAPQPLSPQTLSPLPRSTPLSLRIPSIDLSIPLITLGLNPDQTVEVPTDFTQAGWYRQGPTPGEVGSAVILGHVDSYQGPAVFYRLHDMSPGDRVEVDREDGTTAHFEVTSVQTYPKTQFPADQVYANNDGIHLQLVTCGGGFDTTARSYLSNVVVYTTLIPSTPIAAQHAAA